MDLEIFRNLLNLFFIQVFPVGFCTGIVIGFSAFLIGYTINLLFKIIKK